MHRVVVGWGGVLGLCSYITIDEYQSILDFSLMINDQLTSSPMITISHPLGQYLLISFLKFNYVIITSCLKETSE